MQETRPIGSDAEHLLHTIDWSKSTLGPYESWPNALRSALFSCFASQLPTAVYWGKDFHLFYNDSYVPIAGLKHPKAFGQPASVAWKEIWPALKPQFDGVAETKKGIALKNQMLLMDRFGKPEEAFFDYTLSPILDADYNFLGVHNSAIEITDRIRAERRTAASLAQVAKAKSDLLDVLENMNDAYFALDKDWVITDVNRAHETFTQTSRVDQVGKSFINLFLGGKRDSSMQYYMQYHKVLTEKVSVTFEEYYPPLDLWTLVSAYPTNDGGIAVFFKDITVEKRANQDLKEAKLEAERANHLKSAFLANMSHEIRTPLGAMIGFAELLGDPGATAAERANYIDILQKNGARLGHVINDILDLSKVETGHISFEYVSLRPLNIAHEVVSLMSVLAKEKGLALSFHDDGTTPETVISDPTRVRQVLMNLVSNALKFTKVGSIQISLSGYDGHNGEKCCAFEVVDTGVGIPASATERLFKMFSQADNSMTRKYGGTGLGLALSRALARSMGGNVRLVKSDENIGSTFHFSIESREDLRSDLMKAEELKSKSVEIPLAPDALVNVRILLVEDSPDNQQLIWRYLSKYGARVEIADNGSEGVAQALANDHDIVLMDLQMPVMDGYTAIGKLRSRGYKTPMIALTAHAMADVKKKCEALGFNGHLPKPINSRELVETIMRLVKPHAPE